MDELAKAVETSVIGLGTVLNNQALEVMRPPALALLEDDRLTQEQRYRIENALMAVEERLGKMW